MSMIQIIGDKSILALEFEKAEKINDVWFGKAALWINNYSLGIPEQEIPLYHLAGEYPKIKEEDILDEFKNCTDQELFNMLMKYYSNDENIDVDHLGKYTLELGESFDCFYIFVIPINSSEYKIIWQMNQSSFCKIKIKECSDTIHSFIISADYINKTFKEYNTIIEFKGW